MLAEWIVAGAAAGGIVFEVWRRLRKFDRGLQRFLADWNGTPGRPGVAPRAGVLERLSMIEVAQVDNRAQISDTRVEITDINRRLKERGL